MPYDDIESKVTHWMQGKHGMIGLIVPDRKPTQEEWVELHRTIAEVIVNEARAEQKKQKEDNEKAAG